MGIKTYNPYTPSRRQMTGSDFSEITKTTPEKSLLESKKRKAIVAAELRRNIELSTLRERKTEFRQQLLESSMIQIEVLTSH